MLGTSFYEDLARAVLQGTPPGTVYALIALGFVLTYKTSGVFNLAFGAQAYVSAGMFFHSRTEWGWSRPVAFVFSVVLLAPAIGLILERFIFRPLRTASAVSKLVTAVGLSVALPALFELVSGFEAVAGRTPEGILPDGARVFYDPFGLYPWSRNELVQLFVAVAALALIGAFFKYSAMGLSMRAVVESPRMTELSGINADRVSALAWAVSSFFAGLAGVLIAPRFNTLIAPDFFNIMVVAIAAAGIGQLVNFRGAVVGGLLLGIIIALFNTFLPRWSDTVTWLAPIQENLTPALPFVVLFVIIVAWPATRRPREASDPLSGVDPPPPAIAANTRSATMTKATRIFTVLFLSVVGWLVFFVADVSWIFLVTQAVVISVILLSVTVMTGLGGQISLAQGAFAATGAFTVFQFSDRWGTNPLISALVGAGVAAAVGMLLALPVLRLGGVWFAVATLAFAFFFDSVLLKMPFVSGGDTSLLQGTRVPRPDLFGISFESDKSFLILCIVVLVAAGLLVIQVREGTIGRTLKALRGSELAAASIGINGAKARIMAFGLSAALAGAGGALTAMHQENVNYANNFAPAVALFWLVLVVTLSARTVEGAVQAGTTYSLFGRIILTNLFHLPVKWRFVLFGFGAVQFARHPEGMLEYGKRRSTAKWDARIQRIQERRAAKRGVSAGSES
jgi:branched-subunit amino acid ABC-type transport system permease component